MIFAELEITFHNQFHKAFPDEETLTLAKQLWLAKPSSSNIGQLASIHFEDLVVNEPYSLVPSYIAPFKTGT